MTAVELREIAEKYQGEYDIVGARTQEQPFQIGDIDHVSSVWEDEEETEELLGGISVTDIDSDSVKMHTGESINRYFGEHMAIICGDRVSYGEDAGEVVIANAVVVEIIK